MKINSVGFVMSAGSAAECPPGPMLEIGVSGRSNVGKSSLLNSLLGRKAIAKVSSTPGKTQRLNYYLVNDAFHLVDLPGYGYAKAPKTTREHWREMMQRYLRTRTQLGAVLQLVDSRHVPSQQDREMVQWLRDEQLPFCLVATKMDKLGQSERRAALRAIAGALHMPRAQPVVPHSSETGEGREAVLAWIGETLETMTGR